MVLTLFPVPLLLSSTLLLITLFWMAFLFNVIMPLTSIRTPTEILFTGDIVEILSPMPIDDYLSNSLRLDRSDIRFGAGYIAGRIQMLDRLTLYFQSEENYSKHYYASTWVRKLSKAPDFGADCGVFEQDFK